MKRSKAQSIRFSRGLLLAALAVCVSAVLCGCDGIAAIEPTPSAEPTQQIEIITPEPTDTPVPTPSPTPEPQNRSLTSGKVIAEGTPFRPYHVHRQRQRRETPDFADGSGHRL